MRVAAADAPNCSLDRVHSLAELGVFNRKWHQESQHVIVRTRAYRGDSVPIAILQSLWSRYRLVLAWPGFERTLWRTFRLNLLYRRPPGISASMIGRAV